MAKFPLKLSKIVNLSLIFLNFENFSGPPRGDPITSPPLVDLDSSLAKKFLRIHINRNETVTYSDNLKLEKSKIFAVFPFKEVIMAIIQSFCFL